MFESYISVHAYAAAFNLVVLGYCADEEEMKDSYSALYWTLLILGPFITPVIWGVLIRKMLK